MLPLPASPRSIRFLFDTPRLSTFHLLSRRPTTPRCARLTSSIGTEASFTSSQSAARSSTLSSRTRRARGRGRARGPTWWLGWSIRRSMRGWLACGMGSKRRRWRSSCQSPPHPLRKRTEQTFHQASVREGSACGIWDDFSAACNQIKLLLDRNDWISSFQVRLMTFSSEKLHIMRGSPRRNSKVDTRV